MKLNMDCVRAVMLCAEEYTDYNHYCYFISYQKNNVNDFLLDDPETPPAYQLELEKTYDNDDLFYAVEYCVKSGLLPFRACSLHVINRADRIRVSVSLSIMPPDKAKGT